MVELFAPLYNGEDNGQEAVPFSPIFEVKTGMERLHEEWAAAGLKMPKLVYWNVNAQGTANILDLSPDVSYVSGCSPVIFESVLTGKTGWDLCLEKICSERYNAVSA